MADVLTPDRPIIGLRDWRVTEDNILRGISATDEWKPGDNTASGVPKADNSHIGLHAYSPLNTEKLMSNAYYLDEVVICGVVIGWGNVCVHATGWRAEHSRIVALASWEWHVSQWATDYRQREKSDEEVRALYPGGEDAFVRLTRHYEIQTVDSIGDCASWAQAEGLGTILPRTAHTYVEYASAQKQAREWQMKADQLRLQLEAGKDRAALLAPIPDA
jgi:hypothetical protein